MIRTLLAASLALAASAVAHPQDRPAATRPVDAAQAAYDALLAEYTAESEVSSAARRAVYESEAYKQARADRDSAKAGELLKDVPVVDRNAWGERFLNAAARHASSDAQPLFYAWVVTNGSKKELVEQALEPLLDEHLKSDHWLALSSTISRSARTLGQERTLDVLATLAAGHPLGEVKANALFARYNLIVRAEGSSDEDKAAAELDRKRAIELAPNSTTGLRAAAIDFERERLQIGMPVPDIQAEDTSGVEFKLSDYKGKVVVLDFWGDW